MTYQAHGVRKMQGARRIAPSLFHGPLILLACLRHHQ